MPQIVAIFEYDCIEFVEFIGQLVGVLPDEPERLLGGVHHLALAKIQLSQHHRILQRRVKVLKALNVVRLKKKMHSNFLVTDLLENPGNLLYLLNLFVHELHSIFVRVLSLIHI